MISTKFTVAYLVAHSTEEMLGGVFVDNSGIIFLIHL